MKKGYKTIWEEQYENIPDAFVSILERKKQKYVQVEGNVSPNHLASSLFPITEEQAEKIINGAELEISSPDENGNRSCSI